MNERTKGWPSHRIVLGAGIMVLGLTALLLPAAGSGAAREEGKEKLCVSPRFCHAMLATQLAMQGEKRKSPILMLAAAELARSLHAAGGGKEFRIEGEGAKEVDKDQMQMSVAYLVDRAKTFAKEDADLAPLVQKVGEQLTSRGLDPKYAEKFPEVPGKPDDKVFFKIIGAAQLPAEGTGTVKDIPFVADKVACLGCIGVDNSDNLSLEVRDEDGKLIENPPGIGSKRVIIWVPHKAQTVTAVVHNNGPEQKVGLLANWDKE